MIVIDSSSLVKYMLKEEGWLDVEEYLVKGVYSIDHAVKEVANAIWKHVIIYGKISKELGITLYMQLKKLVKENIVIVEPQNIYIDKAIEIALKHKITVYDSLYIAQALKHRRLLTSDKQQVEVARKYNVKIHYIP